MAHVDRPLLEVALDGPGKAAQALLQQLSSEEASNSVAGSKGTRGPDDRPALLTGKCELLGDGLDTGFAAKDLATQARAPLIRNGVGYGGPSLSAPSLLCALRHAAA